MPATEHSLPVYPASAFRVAFGVKEGDPLGPADTLLMDDQYELSAGLRPTRLNLRIRADGGLETPRKDRMTGVRLDCVLRFMCPDRRLIDALMLHVGDARFLSPLHGMVPRRPYMLMAIDHSRPREVFARITTASFASGTQITLPCGAQQPIETLRVGDRVLTRDDGPQEIRWIGQTTQRATGAMAPIELAPGTLHNTGNLLLSPLHRLFVYQRSDALGLGRAEVAVRARDLLGSDGVTRRAGGFVDYVQLVFDNHQIIYAEGIAAESMLVDARARPLIPATLARDIAPGHATSDLSLLDMGPALNRCHDRAAHLRASSTR